MARWVLALAGAFLLALTLPAAAKPFDERLFDAARRDEERLLASERSQRFRDGWEKVIGEYAVISDQHPKSRLATEALYRQGELWRKLYRRSWLEGDLDRAQKAYAALVQRYPASRFAPAALMGSADVLETKGDKAGAHQALDRLVRAYPRNEAVAKARAKMAELAPFIPKPAPRARTVVSSPRSAPAFSSVAPSRPSEVEDIRFWSNPDYTRVVVYTAGPVAVRKSLLPADVKAGKPPRLTLDLSPAFLARPKSEPIPIGDGLLRQVRASQFDPRTVRIVLDIESIADHQLFTLENPSRVVVDVSGARASLPQAPPGGEKAAVGGKPPAVKGAGGDRTLSLAQQLGLGVKRIVIDPGHGGDAPGAVGQGGLLEKEVTLAVSRKLRQYLTEKGYEVLLTREGDTSLRLEERTAFANQKGADLFISVHCNASRNRAARGIETYFLGVAKDRAASETALLENALREERTLSDLEKILLDLTRASKMKESAQLAERIQGSICERIRCRYDEAGQDKGVKQAPFYVLVGTRMPAVLVEVSYISHPEEEKLLGDEAFRDQLAQSLAAGVTGYAEWLNAGAGSMASPPVIPALPPSAGMTTGSRPAAGGSSP